MTEVGSQRSDARDRINWTEQRTRSSNIFDFRFWIESRKNKPMTAFPSKSLSDHRKAAPQNPKWLRLSVIAFVLVVAGESWSVGSIQIPD